MCGICGKLNFNSEPVPQELIQQMNSRMIHRGPDEEGTFFSKDGSFGMGMRRLKIIDLSTGSQPIFNETKEIAVVLNGEIYNYIELRKELEKRGHIFSTHSDTEVIVHAYETYGMNFLNLLNGMFAFALWDHKTKNVIIARDRMGIKPLYYRLNPKNLSFASEIKSLLADPECSREIDFLSLDNYFSMLYVPGPNTIFRSIKKLEPGHALICNLEKKKADIHAYWQYPLIIGPEDYGWKYYEEGLDNLFKDALKLQLRSDVPNGVFLSSGLDSSLIAYYASQVSSKKINTFTVHFQEESYSEKDGAKKISKHCNCNHHEIELKPNVEELILKTSEFFDEPFADTSAIPTFLLCEYARKNITVALSGEGGDELFAGYPTYIATKFAPYYRKIPRWIRKEISKMAEKIPVSWDRLTWEFKLKEFIRGAENSPERSHFAWKEIFTEELKEKLYSSYFLEKRKRHDGFESFNILFERTGNGTELEKLLFVDQQTYLLDQFLVKSDRMSMANSLEVRVPILDHRIVEFAARIPPQYKIKGLTTKWTLRKLLNGKLPQDIVWGSKKGFSPPIPYWLSGSLKPFLEETLSENSVNKTGLFHHETIRQIMKEHFEKKKDHHRRLWALLNFILWYRRWA